MNRNAFGKFCDQQKFQGSANQTEPQHIPTANAVLERK